MFNHYLPSVYTHQYPPTFPLSNSSSQGSLLLFRLSPSTTVESMAFLPPSQDFTAQGEGGGREGRKKKERREKKLTVSWYGILITWEGKGVSNLTNIPQFVMSMAGEVFHCFTALGAIPLFGVRGLAGCMSSWVFQGSIPLNLWNYTTEENTQGST